MRNYDLEFLKRFSLVIAFLVAITLGLIVAAIALHRVLPPEVDPAAAKRTENRIAPVGAVYAGSTGLMPAKGGNPALTDEQVQVTVDWMLDNLK